MKVLFDTHCHFDPDADIAGEIARARAAGLVGLLAVGGDEAANRGAEIAVSLAPGFAFPAFGFDYQPHNPRRPPRLPAFDSPGGGVFAVGEIGLDYSHGDTAEEKAAQRERFVAQLELAAEKRLPVSLHCREAADDMLAILREHTSPVLMAECRSGALHCFTGPADFAAELLPLGYSFGISGIVTFSGASALRQAVRTLPLDRILVETDSPFLAPVPRRGHRCEPAFVAYTCDRVADELGVDREEFAAVTTRNALRLFAIPSAVAPL